MNASQENKLATSTSPNHGRRRPGPFGPAWALLPKEQQPIVIDDDMPAYDAIERMVDNNFSQLPVKNSDDRIIGVFTWKSFGKRVCDLRSVRGSFKPVEMPVREALEPPRFISPEVCGTIGSYGVARTSRRKVPIGLDNHIFVTVAAAWAAVARGRGSDGSDSVVYWSAEAVRTLAKHRQEDPPCHAAG